MKKQIFFLLLLMIFVSVPSNGHGRIYQVTDNNIDDCRPSLYNGTIAWDAGTTNADHDIYYWDGNSVTNITNDGLRNERASLYDGTIAWGRYVGQFEAWYWDGQNTRLLAENALHPSNHNGNVAWYRDNPQGGGIFLWNGDTIKEVSDGQSKSYNPSTYNDTVAWVHFDGNDREIFYWDGQNTLQVTDNDIDDHYLQLYDGTIAFRRVVTGTDMYYWDGNNTTLLYDNPYSWIEPTWDPLTGMIVWWQHDGNDGEIFYWDGNTVTQLTYNDTDDRDPTVYNGTIVWMGSDGSDYEIFYWDGGSGGITWYDANKNYIDDSYMCWAASASNVLAYTGWDGGLNDENEIFAHFVDHWTNKNGTPPNGWNWWFDGTNPMEGSPSYSQVDVPGGGAFYPFHDFSYYLHKENSTDYMIPSIDSFLKSGYGVSVMIARETHSTHLITAWALEYDDATGEYVGLYATDSDDGMSGLRYYTVGSEPYYGGIIWTLNDTYKVGPVYALARNPGPMPAPLAGFSATPLSGTAPLEVAFSDESTGMIATWEWDFGDNSDLSSEQNPSYTYDNPGTYTVSLIVTGPGGSDTETKTDYITVTYPAPVANFSADVISGVHPLTVNFTDQSTGEITSRSWAFGDDSTSTNKNPSHIYDNPGTYTVSLTCTGPGGSDTETKNDYIVIDYIAPIANFLADFTEGMIPFAVSFTDKSTGDITNWLWDFGDDESSTDENPFHTYSEEGLYTVTLSVSGPEGLDTEIKTDYITAYEELTLTDPNGGEIITSGSYYTIEWVAPFIADNFRLKLSTDKGKTWEKIEKGITDTSYGWDVPTPKQNKTKCLVKVQAFDSNGDKIGVDQSDTPFTIEVLTITSPQEGEPLTSGSDYTIEWDTNETRKPVDKVYLKYSKNGGTTWNPIAKIVGDNPGEYLWTVPDVNKTKNKCMIKVVLKNANNKIVGKAVSDGFFTIEP